MLYPVPSNMFHIALIVTSLFHRAINASSTSSNTEKHGAVYKIEGNILFSPGTKDVQLARVLVNEGQFIGFPRVNGSFVIAGVTSGSYIVSVNCPSHIFESVRVDISKTGKIRARKLNLVDPHEVNIVRYPVRFEQSQKSNYFQKRETFCLIDMISHPIFIQFFLPVVMLLLLPKLLPQGVEMQQTLEQANDIVQPQMNLPDLTDLCIRFFGDLRR